MTDHRGYSGEAKVIADFSPRLTRFMTWIFTRQLKKNFHAIHLLSAPPTVDGPLICVMNHPSWNDPMLIMFLSYRFFPSREAYGPIDARALEGYGFFSKTGLYGVTHGNAGGIRQFLRTSLAILNRSATVIWITAQGKFSDIRERPVKFEPGLGGILQAIKEPVTVLVVAVEYGFGVEQKPEIFVHFGEPVSLSPGSHARALTARCEQMMERAQDYLAQKVITKNLGEFQTILGGAVGVGGFYGLWQRGKAVIQGKKYDPSHKSLTS